MHTRWIFYLEEADMKFIQLLTGKQLSKMLGIPEGTLRYWRSVGLGPVWHKLEGSIRYDLVDVEAYVQNSRRIPSVRAFMEERNGIA
jgi:Helix-turn-helix domain